MKKLLFILFISVIIAMANLLYAQHEGHKMQETKQEIKDKEAVSQKKIYYCPMHPTYTSDKPGDCPICNMTLVAKEEEQIDTEAMPEGAVKIDSYKQQLIGVKTDKVIYRPLVRTLRTVGRVAFDPELYKSQQEYIEAVKTLDKISASEDKETLKNIQSLVNAAALKLKLSGLSQKQIEDLAKNKENDETLLISSDQTTWVYATIYEYETDLVKIGQEATIKTISYPDKEFKGKIVSLDPIFDAMTRSIRARIKTDNPDDLLKPNMFVDVEMYSDLGADLAIPKEAIMDTGTRKMVFISLPNGYFKPQEIKIGVSTDEYAQIKEGLKEGDIVVVSGNFLIDSESKLKAALEGTGHQHGQ